MVGYFSDNSSVAQFYIFANAEVTDLGIPYDYSSVMHYPMNALAIDKTAPTIVPKQKGKTIGQRVKLSTLDVRRVNKLYRCEDNLRDIRTRVISGEIDEKYRRRFRLYFKLCDGNMDTEEGWDEVPDICLRMCRTLDSPALGPDGFNLFNLPDTKQCIHKTQLCDNKTETLSRLLQDKMQCLRYCKRGGYTPMPGTAQCLHVSKLCDGVVDTANGDDEKQTICQQLCHLPSTGLQGQLFNFPLLYNRCYPKVWITDRF